jgi:hypothetical protein
MAFDDLPKLRVNPRHAARERHADARSLRIVDLQQRRDHVGPRAVDGRRGFYLQHLPVRCVRQHARALRSQASKTIGQKPFSVKLPQ